MTIVFDRARALAALDEVLTPGLDLEALLERRLPGRRRELLRRAALPRVFDRALVSSVLLPDLPAPAHPQGDDIEWLIAHADIEPASPTTWRMRDAERTTRLAAWFGSPNQAVNDALRASLGEARRLSRALATALRRRGPAWEIERLSQLTVCDPRAAARLLRRLYAAADRHDDFARCYLLLQTVEDRREHLAAYQAAATSTEASQRIVELHRALDGLQARYDARRAFLQDLEKTSHVLERGIMREEWKRLLAARSRRPPAAKSSGRRAKKNEWIVHLESQGGSGKTMYLRWLSTRKCLPHGVPYARIDFDFNNPELTKVAPWLLLMRLARQLDPQLPGRPFTPMLQRAQEIAGIAEFMANAWGGRVAVDALREESAAELGEQFVVDFVRRMKRAQHDKAVRKPLIFALDTVEVAVLTEEGDLLAFLELFERIHEAAPSVRLIISGRFDLFKRVPGFAERFGAATRRLGLTRFNDSESRAYLRLRGLPDNRATRAIVRRAKGFPFVLSLFADEWQQRGALTEQEVRDTPGPELHYLVDRVLKRIPEVDIRWLLRYGVVPHRLTREFLRDVMLDDMRVAMRGASRSDRLAKGERVLAPFFTATGEDTRDDGELVRVLWEGLERYASTVSFVSRDPAQPDTLVFHEDVLRPMRRELGKQRVFRRLHRAALDHATRRAAAATLADAATWERHTRDAIYHAFQISERLGNATWKAGVAAAQHARSWEALFGLGVELQRPEYVDEDGRPLVRRVVKGKSIPLVAPALLVQAALCRADAAVRVAAESKERVAREWWKNARTALAYVERLRRLYRRVRVSRGLLGVLRVRVAARTSSSPEARRALASLRAKARSPNERCELTVALAESYAGDPRALVYYDEALALAKRTRISPPERARLRERVADEYFRQDRYQHAVEHMARLRSEWGPLSVPERLLALTKLAHAFLKVGEIRNALTVVRQARTMSEKVRPPNFPTDPRLAREAITALAQIEERAARAQRFAGDLDGAEQAAKRALEFAATSQNVLTDAERAVLDARARVEIVQVLIARRQWKAAVRELGALRQYWGSVYNTDGVARAVSLTARFYHEEIGDLTQVAQTLTEGRDVHVPRERNGWWLLAHERVYALWLGGSKGARAAAQQMLRVAAGQPPRHQILAALATLSLGTPSRPAERMLVDAVKAMSPRAGARRFLGGMLHVDQRLALRPTVREELRETLGVQWSSKPDARRAARRLWWRDRLDRALIAHAIGCDDDATAWVDSVRDEAARKRDVRLLGEAAALAWELESRRTATATAESLQAVSPSPDPGVLGMAALLEARDAWRRQRPEESLALANLAVAQLDDSRDAPTVWLARALRLRGDLGVLASADRRRDLGRARSLMERLGRHEEAGPVIEDLETEEFPVTTSRDIVVGPPLDLRKPAETPLVVRLRLEATPGLVVGDVLSDERPNPEGPYAASVPAISAVFARAMASGESGSRGIISDLAELFTSSWPETTRQMRGLLPSRELPREVSVVVGESMVQALPIELASAEGRPGSFVYRSIDPELAEGEHTLRVQRVLNSLATETPSDVIADGVSGPVTRGALAKFQKDRGLAATGVMDEQTARHLSVAAYAHRPRVLVLAPEERAARFWKYGEEVQARRLAEEYRRVGYEVEVLEAPDSPKLTGLVQWFDPQIVHIRGPLIDSYSQGGIAIDFGVGQRMSKAGPSAGTPTASMLATLLARPAPTSSNIVIIDVPLAGGEYEDVCQLLWRNAFASQLFGVRTVGSVLGIGFGDASLQDEMSRRLINGLAGGASLAAVTSDLRGVYRARRDSATGPERIGREAATLGTGLWAVYPSFVHVPVQGSSA